MHLHGYCHKVGVDRVETPIVTASVDKGIIVEFVPVKNIFWLRFGVHVPAMMNEKKEKIK